MAGHVALADNCLWLF